MKTPSKTEPLTPSKTAERSGSISPKKYGYQLFQADGTTTNASFTSKARLGASLTGQTYTMGFLKVWYSNGDVNVGIFYDYREFQSALASLTSNDTLEALGL